jgi:hypothetical protein
MNIDTLEVKHNVSEAFRCSWTPARCGQYMIMNRSSLPMLSSRAFEGKGSPIEW